MSSMSAADNLQMKLFNDNVQLKLFEKAKILASSPSDEQEMMGLYREPFVEQKLEESHNTVSSGSGETAPDGVNTTYESVKKYGVQNPVRVKQHGEGNYTLVHGHHRVYSANDIDPEMWIPLRHGPITDAEIDAEWTDPTQPEDDPRDRYRGPGA